MSYRLLVVLAILLGCWNISIAQDDTLVDMNEVQNDISVYKQRGRRYSVSSWIATEFWGYFIRTDKKFIEADKKSFLAAVDNYIFILTLDVYTDLKGNLIFTDENVLAKSIFIKSDTTSLYPISKDKLKKEWFDVTESVKSYFKNHFGSIGAGFHLFLFSNGKTSEKLIRPNQSGKFSVVHSDFEFVFRYPVAAFLPPKYCPVDNERMKGNWIFCPYHGTKL
jgi:hypothetical protein